MIISEDLAFNIVKDWEKKNISREEKSVFLKELMKKHRISQRELGRKLGIPHSTIQDWISMRDTFTAVRVIRKNRQELIYLSSRLLFMLSRSDTKTFSPKTLLLLNNLRNELEEVLK